MEKNNEKQNPKTNFNFWLDILIFSRRRKVTITLLFYFSQKAMDHIIWYEQFCGLFSFQENYTTTIRLLFFSTFFVLSLVFGLQFIFEISTHRFVVALIYYYTYIFIVKMCIIPLKKNIRYISPEFCVLIKLNPYNMLHQNFTF